MRQSRVVSGNIGEITTHTSTFLEDCDEASSTNEDDSNTILHSSQRTVHSREFFDNVRREHAKENTFFMKPSAAEKIM